MVDSREGKRVLGKNKVFLTLLLLATAMASPAYANFSLIVSTVGAKSPSVITSSNPATGIWCGSSHTACSASFGAGERVTLTVVTASTVAFAGWTGAQGCGTNNPTCTVTMNAGAAVTATFLPLLSVTVSGNGLGSVTDSSATVVCATTTGCTGNGGVTYAYPTGTHIVLTETAGSSSTFVGWTGNAGCNTASTCTFTLNGYQAIVATFTSVGPFTIEVTVVGDGRVTSSPAGIDCGSTCTAEFSSGTVVTLSTSAALGAYFAGWANGGCSGLNVCTVTSTSTYQGLGGSSSPAAFFYPAP